ncbi:antibiotic biosynthesis monooxygenase family protein [Weissella minor]|uniref:ABM domain-containing protein n=1 Tax=Weissella minor TaxID=1620 RepID=A0A0R2JQC4_9LACO|nr:antibiotic biosynthesis monooxygenase [Weissella minor]KRN76317.1 hypothetical protein IV67_GL000893 [Weissella minor]
MTNYLHTTFGSQKVLQTIIEQHPHNELLLTVDDQDQTNFQLLEQLPSETSVFETPVSYQVLAADGAKEGIRGWLHFTFLTLPSEEQQAFIKQWSNYQNQKLASVEGLITSELLQRTDERNQFAIMTTWTVRDYYTIWDTASQGPLKKYTDLASRYNVRKRSYSPAAFTKQQLR